MEVACCRVASIAAMVSPPALANTAFPGGGKAGTRQRGPHPASQDIRTKKQKNTPHGNNNTTHHEFNTRAYSIQLPTLYKVYTVGIVQAHSTQSRYFAQRDEISENARPRPPRAAACRWARRISAAVSAPREPFTTYRGACGVGTRRRGSRRRRCTRGRGRPRP